MNQSQRLQELSVAVRSFGIEVSAGNWGFRISKGQNAPTDHLGFTVVSIRGKWNKLCIEVLSPSKSNCSKMRRTALESSRIPITTECSDTGEESGYLEGDSNLKWMRFSTILEILDSTVRQEKKWKVWRIGKKETYQFCLFFFPRRKLLFREIQRFTR